MSKRHDVLGIKQTIQQSWMDRTLRMLLAGMTEDQIRKELGHYLSNQKQSGGVGERGQKTYGMAIAILASWFSPQKELVGFRDEALALARVLPDAAWPALHWAVISASYPFWLNVARQVGRLFNLQEVITQRQIFNRLKEIYGDRETVARNARYVVRSFVAWGVLKDSETKGGYIQSSKQEISNNQLAIVLYEAALYAHPEGTLSKDQIWHDPAFFPFRLPLLTGDYIDRHAPSIDFHRHGLDNEMLIIKR